MRVVCPYCNKNLSHTAIYRHKRKLHSEEKNQRIIVVNKSVFNNNPKIDLIKPLLTTSQN